MVDFFFHSDTNFYYRDKNNIPKIFVLPKYTRDWINCKHYYCEDNDYYHVNKIMCLWKWILSPWKKYFLFIEIWLSWRRIFLSSQKKTFARIISFLAKYIWADFKRNIFMMMIKIFIGCILIKILSLFSSILQRFFFQCRDALSRPKICLRIFFSNSAKMNSRHLLSV